MTAQRSWQVFIFVGVVLIVGAAGVVHAADPDWKAVEQALGKSGQLQPGDVFRVGMPRTDLAVTVKGVPVYMQFWANDDAATLARGLKAALDLTNSAKATGPR